MVHVLVDDWLYLDINGRPEVCGREEAARHYKSRMKSVRAVFIDCAVRQAAEPLIGSAFTPDHVIQHERMPGGTHQVIGALKTDIERVYHYFKPARVEALVPYPAAIRAFLNGRGLLSADKAIIFLDDLKTQAVLTVVEGMRLSAPRRISMRDTAYMASEIQRHQKNYLSQKEDGAVSRDVSFILVSNNREWLTALCGQGVFAKEDIIHVDHLCPALEGLKNAKFTLHFALPEDAARQRRNKVLGGRAKAIVLSIAMAVSGFGPWALFAGRQHSAQARLQDARLGYRRAADDLMDIHQKKFASFLRKSNSVDYGRLYHDFIRGIPREYLIKEFNFHKGDIPRWEFSGVIYPAEDQAIEKHFERLGLFQNAAIEPVIAQGRFGQKVILTGGGHE